MEFKIGQKVVALVNAERTNGDAIVQGQVYTVAGVDTDLDVPFMEGHTAGFFEDRFKAYVEPVPVLDFTKPLETMDGKPVTLISTEARGHYSVLAYIGDNTSVSTFTKEGKFYRLDDSDLDLRNVALKPVEREVYVNFVKVGTMPMTVSGTYTNRAEADDNASVNRVGCMKIKLVHGVFDA